MSWGVVIGGAVSLVGGAMANRSANKGIDRATAASEQAAREANQLQREIWQQGRSDNEPFRQSALTANSALMSLFGLGGTQATGAQGSPTQQGWMTGQVGGQAAPTQPGGLAGMLGQGPGGGARFATAGLGGQQLISGNQSHGVMPHRSVGYTMPEGAIGVGGGSGPQTQGWRGGQMFAGQQQAPAQTPMQSRQAMFDLWRGTPGYQFNLDEGRKQLESSAAARGGLFSGKAGKALTQYGQNYADRTYDDYVRNLQSMAGVAQTVNSQNAQMGMNYGNSVGTNTINAGNTRASGLMQQGQNNAQFASGVAGLLNNGFQNWNQYRQYGGGGG